MTPKEVLRKWVAAFGDRAAERSAALYRAEAVHHQDNCDPAEGRAAVRAISAAEFDKAEMTCRPENIFENGPWILQWKDQLPFVKRHHRPFPVR